MSAWYNLPGTWDADDVETLEALASYRPAPSFEQAFRRLSGDTDRAVAEAAYSDFLRYHQPDREA